jgi:hypothetical protein
MGSLTLFRVRCCSVYGLASRSLAWEAVDVASRRLTTTSRRKTVTDAACQSFFSATICKQRGGKGTLDGFDY